MIRFLALIAILATSVSSYRPGDEECIISKDNACPADKLTLSKNDSSALIYPGGNTRCAFDNFSSNISEFKTNATYFFQVFPKKDKKKVLLYFQGGGACVDDQTCNFAAQCSSPISTFQPNAVAKSSGVLNATDPLNAFKDWNVIHVPYCTGDLHVGRNKSSGADQTTAFSNDGVCNGKNIEMHMNGFENSMSALNWAVANYPDPEQLVLSGSSAGALGAQFMAEMVAQLWKIEGSNKKFAVLADSYVGVLSSNRTGGELANYFGACDLPLGLSANIVAKCKDGSASVLDIMQNLLQETLFSDWLHVDSKGDKTQRYFSKLFEVGIDQVLYANLSDPDAFYNSMNTIITGQRQVSTRVSTFFVDGDKHVFLLDDGWYNTQRAETNETLGPFVKAWLDQNVAGLGSNVDKEKKAGVPAPGKSAATKSGMMVASVVALVLSVVFAL